MDFPLTGRDTNNFAGLDPTAIDFNGDIYQCTAPVYEPDFWNVHEVSSVNNCYNYAVNVVSDSSDNSMPGAASGYDIIAALNYYVDVDPYMDSCRPYREAAISDGLEFIGEETNCPNGKSLVALFTSPLMEAGCWHWYRQDSSGEWSEKFQAGPAKMAMHEDVTVTDIRDVDTMGTEPFACSKFCGHFCVCSNVEQGFGYEKIDDAY